MMKFKLALAMGVLVLAFGCTTPPKKAAPAATPSPAAAVAPKKVEAKVAADVSGVEVSCENGADKRVLTVVTKAPGCELHYSKFGKSDVVASSAARAEYCAEVQQRIKTKLEAAQFTCK